MGSKDVAIYTVANRSYARLFSATSEKARSLGNSINYSEMDAMYTVLAGKKVYINKIWMKDIRLWQMPFIRKMRCS